jgi:hypothetical protein
LLLNPSFQEYSIETFHGLPKGYEWKVIVDPTRNPEYPGLFFGRFFRIFDLHMYPGEKPTWPDGITFQNIKTGQKVFFDQGKLQRG